MAFTAAADTAGSPVATATAPQTSAAAIAAAATARPARASITATAVHRKPTRVTASPAVGTGPSEAATAAGTGPLLDDPDGVRHHLQVVQPTVFVLCCAHELLQLRKFAP